MTEKQDEPVIPTTERLAQALELVCAPAGMIAAARAGMYDDFRSAHPAPIALLIEDARRYHLDTIVAQAKNGDFDASREEGEAWLNGEEGQEIARQITNSWPKGTRMNKNRFRL